MPGFFYFLPFALDEVVIKKRLDRDALRRADLVDVLADVVEVPDDCVVTSATIDGQAGTMLVPKSPTGSDPLEWTHNATIQTLQPRVGPGVLIGWETARPPQPEDLARKTQIGGATIQDKLDQTWRLPVARSPRGRSQLPAEYVRTAAGVERRIDAAHTELWDLSGKIRDWIHGQLELPTDRETWVYDAALRILQSNYRIGVREANLLQQLGRGILTTNTVEPILVACVDWDLPQRLAEALEKKTETPASD